MSELAVAAPTRRRYAIRRETSHELLVALVRHRKAIRMSQAELSKRVRRSAVQVHKWETGKSEPTLRNLENWCDVLGFRLEITEKGKKVSRENEVQAKC